jgi:hypothetical protein
MSDRLNELETQIAAAVGVTVTDNGGQRVVTGIRNTYVPGEYAPHCRRCDRYLYPREPAVYTLRSDLLGIGLHQAVLCSDCQGTPLEDGERDDAAWVAVTRTRALGNEYYWHCRGCDRRMSGPGLTKRQKYCTPECARLHRRHRRHRLTTTTCNGCGETFVPDRNDSRYCTNACRQAAYRRRSA